MRKFLFAGSENPTNRMVRFPLTELAPDRFVDREPTIVICKAANPREPWHQIRWGILVPHLGARSKPGAALRRDDCD
jgi:hypothetical protein